MQRPLRPARPRSLLAFTAGALLTAAAGSAAGDERATAQLLFQQGKELMRAGSYAQACPKFEAAEQYSATPGVRLNLAECWTKLGRTASAWGKYDEALALAQRAGDKVATDVARAGKAALDAQLVYMTVVVSPETAALPGIEVQRDGEKLLPAAWGLPIPVDPGKHEVSADAPGRTRWAQTTTVEGAGSKVSVAVPALGATAALAPVVSEGAHAGSTQRLAGWITGGAGVATLGVATYFIIDALSERSDYRSHLTKAGQCADATCQTDSHAAYVAGNVATGTLIAGAALLVGGGALVLTAKAQPHAASARLVPVVTPQTAGVGLVGTW